MTLGEAITVRENPLFHSFGDLPAKTNTLPSGLSRNGNVYRVPTGTITIQAGEGVAVYFFDPTFVEMTALITYDGGVILSDQIERMWNVKRTPWFNRSVFVSTRWRYPYSLTPLPRIAPSLKQEQANVVSQPHIEALEYIKETTGLADDRIAALLGVSRQALDAWRSGKSIKDKNRQRIFAVRDVIERATKRYQTRDQLLAWLDDPRGLDGYTPAKLLAAGEIDRARFLAVAYRSPGLRAPRAWTRQEVARPFRGITEYRDEAVPPEPEDHAE